MTIKSLNVAWGYNSVVKYLPRINETLGFIPSTTKKRKTRRKKRNNNMFKLEKITSNSVALQVRRVWKVD
jgi:hypothetical protein